MTRRPLYQHIARKLVARKNAQANNNEEWADRHYDTVAYLVKEYAPSGSGFDSGTVILWDGSGRHKLVFQTSFHHLNEQGFYEGWTKHSVVATPSFDGIDIKVTGRDKNGIKDYIGDIFHEFLTKEVEG